METANNTEDNVLMLLLKEHFSVRTVTSLAQAIKITRQGLWKALSKLEEKNLVLLEKIGKTKTSSVIVKLNWNNPLIEKALSFILTREALNYQRWMFDFNELKYNADFVILFGSILHSPKEANDVDIISVVSNSKNLIKINKIISEVQKTQGKKIHAINMTKDELEKELNIGNNAYLEAVKKGIVLFGQDNLIKFIKELRIR